MTTQTLLPGQPVTDARASCRRALLSQFAAARAWTETLCTPLEPEDYVVQSMPDCSPAKWHLAHTSWFFETFLLKAHAPGYCSLHPQYDYLFNSYYNAVGERHCRAKRGLVSRPTVAEVYEYRGYVNARMTRLLEDANATLWDTLEPLVTLGIHHEQQHQELLVTDFKHLFSENPLCPVYRAEQPIPNYGPLAPNNGGTGGEVKEEKPSSLSLLPIIGAGGASCPEWLPFPAGVRDIGHDGDGFAFDNEGPRHPEYVPAFALASRLVTNRDWLAFMNDGGYARPQFWLSAGWATVQAQGWNAPLYWWNKPGAGWQAFTLHGMTPLVLDEPVCHVSLYEADAYAQWAGARLPTEAEWEVASETVPLDGPFAESEAFHPQTAPPAPQVWGEDTLKPGSVSPPLIGTARSLESDMELPSPKLGGQGGPLLTQMFGDVWQWTRSQYSPYPGFRAAPGALGEYNGKFMCNQFVLRGGSCATPRSHIRRTYRNFFPPDARWQFTGLRLAKDL